MGIANYYLKDFLQNECGLAVEFVESSLSNDGPELRYMAANSFITILFSTKADLRKFERLWTVADGIKVEKVGTLTSDENGNIVNNPTAVGEAPLVGSFAVDESRTQGNQLTLELHHASPNAEWLPEHSNEFVGIMKKALSHAKPHIQKIAQHTPLLAGTPTIR